jgi:hypothetical protein
MPCTRSKSMSIKEGHGSVPQRYQILEQSLHAASIRYRVTIVFVMKQSRAELIRLASIAIMAFG